LPTSSSLSEFAHTPDRFTRLSAAVERYADERVCIVQGPTWAAVSGVRTEDVAALLTETRERIPAEKRITWWIDEAAQPADLREQLESLGLVAPADGAGLLHALVCTNEPPAGSPDVDVSEVETFEDHLIATDVMWEAFDTPEERRERDRPFLRSSFEAARAAGVPVTFLARLDGRPAALGRSLPSPRGVFLIAGAVAPWARGRGLYRALVRARWDDAVARGTPALVTEAMPDTSYPILKGLGFVDVCLLRRLEDPR
jgi:hypothetical protein